MSARARETDRPSVAEPGCRFLATCSLVHVCVGTRISGKAVPRRRGPGRQWNDGKGPAASLVAEPLAWSDILAHPRLYRSNKQQRHGRRTALHTSVRRSIPRSEGFEAVADRNGRHPARSAGTSVVHRLVGEALGAADGAGVAADFDVALGVGDQQAAEVGQGAFVDTFIAVAGVDAEGDQGRADVGPRLQRLG